MEKEKTFTFNIDDKPLKENLENVNKQFLKVAVTAEDIAKSVNSRIHQVDNTLATSFGKITSYVESIVKMNETTLAKEKAVNDLRKANVKTQIDDLKKVSNVTSDVFKKYDAEEKKILKDREKQRKSIDEAHKKQLDKVRGNKDEELKIRESWADSISKTDNLYLQRYKENLAQRKTALSNVVDQNIQRLNEELERKQQIAIQESIIAKKQAEDQAKAAESIANDAQKKALIAEELKLKLIKIDEDLNKQLTDNAKEHQTVSIEAFDQMVKEITDRVAESKKNNSGITDIALTKANVAAAKEQIEAYKALLDTSRQSTEQHYATLEAIYANDSKMLAKVQEEKAAALKVFDDKHKAADKTLSETEQKGHALRLQQFQDYVKKAEGLTGSINDFTKKYTDQILTGFTAVDNVYNAKIAAITEQEEHLKKKKNKLEEEQKSRNIEITQLEKEKTKATEETNTTAVESLAKRIDAEKQLQKENAEQQQIYTDKEQELKTKKAKTEAEQEKINKIKRKVELVQQITQATVNVAQGVTKALAYGPFIGPVLAAVIGAAGAVQIAIMSKQLAKFEKGGLLRGKRHSQGGMRVEGTNIEVEGGEYVVNRESTSKNLGLIRYINSQRKQLQAEDVHTYFARPTMAAAETPFSRHFEAGGELPTIVNTPNADNEQLVDAIRSMKFEPRVAVTDILRVQDEMASVDGWSGI